MGCLEELWAVMPIITLSVGSVVGVFVGGMVGHAFQPLHGRSDHA